MIQHRRLFRGRTDLYPIRWESKTTGKSGYAPACGNEWRAGVCEKPRIKCGDCNHRLLLPLSDAVIYEHLAGKRTIGVYPLLADDTCHFLAVDFDEADWREDTKAFYQSCHELGVPVALEISRSGKGAHAWIFFAGSVSARDARRLGTAIISHTCARTRQLKLASYDRLFPNQDAMPKGGFGNLIALPLQKHPRENGCSVFVDAELRPYRDQWAFLAAVMPMPKSLTLTLANLIYFGKASLPQSLANRLIRLAAFQNPEFYKKQAMRFSVWDEPRIIGCAENHPHHIALPRGCLDAALELLRDNGIGVELIDERYTGSPLDVAFTGTLRLDQDLAVMQSLSRHGDVNALVENYGHVIVDECHHVGAVSFDAILKKVKAKYVLGLTATPIRRDGQQPIIFMQCGPTRHTAAKPTGAPHDLTVTPCILHSQIDVPQDAGIQDVFRHLVIDQARTDAIAAEVVKAYGQGRKVLVLTERTEHLHAIQTALDGKVSSLFVLHGRISKKQRATLIAQLNTLPPDAARVLLATGKLVGEGFDHPPLDTLVLAMPVSWTGTLQQYAGRLHREHATKTDVRIIDFVDTGQPALLRMWDKRQRGYRAMGYRVAGDMGDH